MTDCTHDARATVRFIHLGNQCPYTSWFRDQAALLACDLGLAFADSDVTGAPEAAAADGAFHPVQIAVPGHSLRTAPRTAERLRADLGRPVPADLCPAAVLPAQALDVPVHLFRRGAAGWAEAVDSTCRLCLGASEASSRLAQACAEKIRWLAELPAEPSSPAPLLLLAGSPAAPAGFAELIPLAAAPVPVPAPGEHDLFLTCVHGVAGCAEGDGDVRLALLNAAISATSREGSHDAAPAIWAVSGRGLPYPNGPLALFLAAGFVEIAGLGRHVVPARCTDELVLVRWQPSVATEPAAVGVLVDDDDDVITLPGGAAAGVLVSAPGLAAPVTTLQAIPPGHKVAVRPVAAGSFVKKYGQPIGRAVTAIGVGEHVHVHNVVSARAGGATAGECGKGGEIGV